ncbi:NAD(P)-dependent oxidoreductase [Methylocella sp.]|uniref:NAD(P)-dependent oxidoreductase n=1 Tax=Methylocella sp. TaxID=1978226 RepID=UPI003784E7D0
MRVAFLGLGRMGSAMAGLLLRHGFAVTVWNRSPGACAPLAAAGARTAATPAEAARGAGAVFTMLADDAALRAVALGADGLAEGLDEGAVHVSMSTISVALSAELAAAHAARGQGYAAAPVFGRPEAAAAQKLFVAAAGPPETLERVRPALEAMSQRVFVMGEAAPDANLVKLSGNFLITCVIEGLAEVFALAQKGGVEPRKLYELFTETLFAAPVYKTYGALILDDAVSPPGFALPLGLKDNRLLLQAGEALAAPLPFASILRDRFLASLAAGEAGLDWSAIARRAAEDAGVGKKTS